MNLRTSKSRAINPEKKSYILLVAWVLLPAVVSFYDILSAVVGRFDAAPGAEIDALLNRLSVHKAAYNVPFFLLGIITVIFAVYLIVIYRRQIFTIVNVKSKPWCFLFLALLLWCIVSTLLSDDISLAFFGKKYAFTGLGAYFIYAGMFISALTIQKEKYRKNILRLFIGVMTYLSALIIGQAFTDSFLDTSMGYDYSAVFFQHNHFGYVLCMGIICAAGLFLLDKSAGAFKKVIYACCMAVQLYGLLLNGTFGSYLAVVVGLPVMYLLYAIRREGFKPYVLIPLIILIALTAVDFAGYVPADEPLAARFGLLSKEVSDISTGSEDVVHVGTGRGTLWMQTVDRIKERPLFGYGPEGFHDETAIISHDGVTEDSPHNEFLQMVGYTGIPSLIFYLAALILLAISRLKKLKELDPMLVVLSGMIVTYLASSFFGNPISNTVVYFWMLLGLISGTDGAFFPATEAEKPKEKKDFKYQGIVLAAMGCVIGTAFVFGISLLIDNEFLNEYSDLHAMRDAELTVAIMQKKDSLGDEKDFWYDANGFSLIPASETAPEAYGKGGGLWGDAKDNYSQLYPNEYDYDEWSDYRDKVIKVHIEEIGEDLKTDMEWIPVK